MIKGEQYEEITLILIMPTGFIGAMQQTANQFKLKQEPLLEVRNNSDEKSKDYYYCDNKIDKYGPITMNLDIIGSKTFSPF